MKDNKINEKTHGYIFFIMNHILLYLSNRAKDEQRHQWMSAIENHQELGNFVGQILVCELHFDPSSIKRRKDRNILAKGTIPTVFTDLNRYNCLAIFVILSDKHFFQLY